MSLSAEDLASFTKIIDSVLAVSDLQTISAKKIRKAIQATTDLDVASHKEALNKLIEERYEACEKKQAESTAASSTGDARTPSPAVDTTSKHVKRSHDESEDGDDEPTPKPTKKVKVKREAPIKDEDDAAYAARLQAEEDSLARPTRGSATRKRAPVKKAAGTPLKKKKKSATKIKASDDSEVETGEDGETKKSGAFHKPYVLSEPLAQLVGESQMSRPQVVKKIWEHVKANDLQKPDDKRQILCDDMLRAVFKQDSVHMFTMNKILSSNLFPIDE